MLHRRKEKKKYSRLERRDEVTKCHERSATASNCSAVAVSSRRKTTQVDREDKIFTFLVRVRPLDAAVIITAAKQEVSGRSMKSNKTSYRGRVEQTGRSARSYFNVTQ